MIEIAANWVWAYAATAEESSGRLPADWLSLARSYSFIQKKELIKN